MLTLIALEFRKLWSARSVRLALALCLLLPWVWPLAPRLEAVYRLVIVSGWQVPSLALVTAAPFLLPLLVALSCSEVLGTEVAQGTLAPLLLRPLRRSSVMLAKLVSALLYPALLLLTLLLGSLLAGLRFGYGDFIGGTGVGPGLFVGQGHLSVAEAFGQVARAYALTALALMPIATLSVLYSALLLNTAASALCTLATLQIMNLLVVFPEALQKLLLSSYLGVTTQQGNLALPISVLLAYTLVFAIASLAVFERRDL